MNYWSDERQRNGENRPRPFGLRRKARHTSFSPLAGGLPQPSGSALSDAISVRSAIHPSRANKPSSEVM